MQSSRPRDEIPRRSRLPRQRWRAAIPVALLCLGAAIAGCSNNGGGNPSPSPTTTSPSVAPSSPQPTGTAAALCDAAAKLKASVQNLTSLDPSAGLPGVQAAIDNIQASLNEFAAAAQTQFAPQVAQMRSALANLKSAVAAASASPGSNSVGAITTAATGVLAAYNSLQQAVSSRCG
ncbi:MAG TPA: hypothetical protein VKB59_09170 [Micromonosporaceae bacterium]|nr:hypothetical protein [Micromonosporaceae bacterium]